ncbi:MAG: phosphodiester glycosidase family protein [Clostridia bacterium]|nr:phosphodiester glycosidase family protein [Clostridia bacterium]
MKKFLKVFVLFLLFQIIYIPLLSIGLIYYGPFKNTREMIVTTAMTTMTHQYFATWFLSDEEIEEILKRNRPQEDVEDTDVGKIEIANKNSNVTDPKEGIEIVDVSSDTYNGYLMIVSDPSRVKIATAPRMGTVGATTSQIVEAYDAIAGINAGGIEDDALSNGGTPSGLLIEDGILKTPDAISGSFAVVGLDNENRMVVSNSITYARLQELGVRDAVSFQPVIIVNGQPTIYYGDGGWGIQPRTAIAQRQDGTILMLVIDGRRAGSIGATLKNVQDILLDYGAYNAFNLDGGASTTMIFDSKLVNQPSDIMGERYVSSAFIVTKPKTQTTASN